MTPEEIRLRFTPAIEEIIDRCRITEEFVDKEHFRVLIATVWGNAVLEPGRSGIEVSDLENLHNFLNEYVEKVLGPQETITTCFDWIMSKKGEDSLNRQQISATHREFLHYFARLILQDVRSLSPD